MNLLYSIPGMNKWLHRNHFSYKKPKGRPHKVDKEQQEQFIKAYETLKDNLIPEDSVYFADSVHPTQASKLSYGWIRKGKNKNLPTTASRTRLNIIGMMNENVRNNHFFKNAKDFKDRIDRLFKKEPYKVGNSLSHRVTDNFQRI